MTPTPRRTCSISLPTHLDSAKTPPTFFPLIMTSLGHFNSASISAIAWMVSATAKPPIKGTSPTSPTGFSNAVMYSPPSGECQLRPRLPLPSVWIEAKMTVPAP